MPDDPYFTDEEAQAYLGGSFTAPEIAAARAVVESRFERICNVSFVPRQAVETLNGTDRTKLGLRWPKVRSIVSVTNAGEAVAVEDIRITALGAYREAGWLPGPTDISSLVITYTHGFDEPPPEVKRAALRYLRDVITPTNGGPLGSPVDDRAIRVDLESGSYQRAVAGYARPTGIPDVDVVLASYDFTRRIPRLV